MTDSDRRGKRRSTLVEGFNNVPNILEKARRAIDDVTQAGQHQGGKEETPAALESQKGGGAGPQRPKAAPRKRSTKASGGQKEPSRPPASKAQLAVPAAASAPDLSGGPQLGLANFGITVKHAIPGRIRLRLHQMLHNEALAEKLQALLAAVPGIASVEVSINTGSLLITYNPREVAAVKSRRGLAGVMQQFFPGLDTESLIKRMLGS